MRLPFARKKSEDARAGLSLGAHGFALAVLRRDGARMRLGPCVARVDETDPAAGAARFIDEIGIGKMRSTGVIEAGDYQLLLVETPDVPAEEVAGAVRWRIKDLVSFPVEDAVIDIFDIPGPANRAQRPMVYAVAAPPGAVRRHSDTMQNAGLNLDSIDIPELCLRNLAALLPTEKFGQAFLFLDEDYGILTLSRAGVLYLIRRLETGLRAVRDAQTDSFSASELVSGMALEIQRSLDYFESHYDQRPIGEVVVSPGAPDAFTDALRDALGVTVQTLDLNELFEMDEPMPVADQPACLLAVGAALRDSVAA